MFGKRSFALYFLVHFAAGLLIAYFVAFNMLHGYSTRYTELSTWEAIWRTISYVIPKWTFFVVLGGMIVTLMSLGLQKLFTSIGQWFQAHQTVNGFSVVLGILMLLLPAHFFLSTMTASFFPHILGGVVGELILLNLVERALTKGQHKAEKRNQEHERNRKQARNLLVANLIGASVLTAIMFMPFGHMPYIPFYGHFVLAFNALLLWAMQSAFFMVSHGCQTSSREIIQGLILALALIALTILLAYGMLYYSYWILGFLGCLLFCSFGLVIVQVRRGYFGLEKAKRLAA